MMNGASDLPDLVERLHLKRKFPDGKSFAFTIFDDTDNATVENVKPVYDLLQECGLLTTKSVWVYPPRGRFTGHCLLDSAYRNFVLDLQTQGFEIALHNVGDGEFTRKEILEGLRLFRTITGRNPATHTNHVSNPDNIYWWGNRFEWPVGFLYTLYHVVMGGRPPALSGDDPRSPWFWGDECKKTIKYIRNLTFNNINTLAVDPLMPYDVNRKRRFSNFWFSSSDGHTVKEMNALIARENCDRLERDGGACIVYTHFASGFVRASGKVDPEFERGIRYLAQKPGWFVPVSTLLDHLLSSGHGGSDPGYCYRLSLNWRWVLDRARKEVRMRLIRRSR
jgi:hypothetical protein